MRNTLRVGVVVAATALAAGMLASCSTPSGGGATSGGSSSAAPADPKMTINVMDVAGNLQLTQGMFDDYTARHPNITFVMDKGTAPDLPGKLKAQQDANNVQIDLVLTGTDALASGIQQGLYLPIAATYKAQLTNMANYMEPAKNMQTLAQDQGVVITYYPSGPLLEYNPDKVTNPPTTPAELLAWAKANPGKFGYARPANSGPGRTFLMGLPYILGDKDPKDPVNGWDKTWAFLADLGQYIDQYPTGTGPTMQNLGGGTWDMIASTTGWDINPRVLGTVPANFKVTSLKGFTWVTDAHYAVIPKGVSQDKQDQIIKVINDILTPEQNAKAYDKGYFYPGPAVKGATLDKAPKESQDLMAQFGRPEYQALIDNNPKALPLDAATMVKAYDLWDSKIGAGKFKTS